MKIPNSHTTFRKRQGEAKVRDSYLVSDGCDGCVVAAWGEKT